MKKKKKHAVCVKCKATKKCVRCPTCGTKNYEARVVTTSVSVRVTCSKCGEDFDVFETKPR